MTRRPYTDDPHLNFFVFEESFVLSLEPNATGFVFGLDVAPSNDNPKWHPPPSNEAITWWSGRLVFEHCTAVDYAPSGAPPAVDANRDEDFGYIDGFWLTTDGYELEGEWGRLILTGGTARVVLDDPSLEA